jgi:hypothetical protein
MLRELLLEHITSQASVKNGGYVEVGYGQVEPNHLSAQRTAQIYAQLPADPSIDILEQGQYVKYDYAAGLVNFTGKGEWMLVYNETKLYREHQLDCEFAMKKGNYQARVYSPLDGTKAAEEMYGPTRFLQGNRERWNGSEFVEEKFKIGDQEVGALPVFEGGEVKKDKDGNPVIADYSVASEEYDYYEMNDVNNLDIKEDYRRKLFMKLRGVKHPEAMMPTGATMVPRVFKTNVGDHYTTNMIMATELKVGDILAPNAKGILAIDDTQDMKWQVVKVYTMPDHQKGVKIMRIA